MSSPTRATTTPSNSLPAQLEQIGLHALAAEVDDFLARATKAALVAAPDSGTSGADRGRRTRPPQSGTAPAPLRDQEVQAHGRLRLVLAHQDRTRRHRTGADVGLPPRSPQPDPGRHQRSGQNDDRPEHLPRGGAGRSLRAVPLRGGFAGRVASPDSRRPPPQAAHLCQRGLTLRR